MKVCVFGAWDPAYPRNRIVREGLRRAGAQVIEARVPERRVWLRYPDLARVFGRLAREADVVFVPEFRHKDMPLAAALHGTRPVVFDPLVSRWDTLVEDWKLHAPGSPQARWNRALDRWTLSLADRVWCDTWAHGALFETLGVPRSRLSRVLVGAEDAFFRVPAPPEFGPLRIAYVGGFLPLHGVPVVIDAIARLERVTGLPDFEVILAGEGIEKQACEARARAAGVRRVRFPGALPYDESPAFLAASHVVLGAFGASEKAGRVVPHKLYQGLAAARAVVSGDGPGVREVLSAGEHLIVVPRADPAALAVALAGVLRDGALRARLGEAARARALEIATVDAVGRSARAALEAAA